SLTLPFRKTKGFFWLYEAAHSLTSVSRLLHSRHINCGQGSSTQRLPPLTSSIIYPQPPLPLYQMPAKDNHNKKPKKGGTNSKPKKNGEEEPKKPASLENTERAYVAASRRSDRSLEARFQSALMASDCHRRRTGKGLRITEDVVRNDDMYEEEDRGLPRCWQRMRNTIAPLSPGSQGRVSGFMSASHLQEMATMANGNAEEVNRQFDHHFPGVSWSSAGSYIPRNGRRKSSPKEGTADESARKRPRSSATPQTSKSSALSHVSPSPPQPSPPSPPSPPPPPPPPPQMAPQMEWQPMTQPVAGPAAASGGLLGVDDIDWSLPPLQLPGEPGFLLGFGDIDWSLPEQPAQPLAGPADAADNRLRDEDWASIIDLDALDRNPGPTFLSTYVLKFNLPYNEEGPALACGFDDITLPFDFAKTPHTNDYSFTNEIFMTDPTLGTVHLPAITLMPRTNEQGATSIRLDFPEDISSDKKKCYRVDLGLMYGQRCYIEVPTKYDGIHQLHLHHMKGPAWKASWIEVSPRGKKSTLEEFTLPQLDYNHSMFQGSGRVITRWNGHEEGLDPGCANVPYTSVGFGAPTSSRLKAGAKWKVQSPADRVEDTCDARAELSDDDVMRVETPAIHTPPTYLAMEVDGSWQKRGAGPKIRAAGSWQTRNAPHLSLLSPLSPLCPPFLSPPHLFLSTLPSTIIDTPRLTLGISTAYPSSPSIFLQKRNSKEGKQAIPFALFSSQNCFLDAFSSVLPSFRASVSSATVIGRESFFVQAKNVTEAHPTGITPFISSLQLRLGITKKGGDPHLTPRAYQVRIDGQDGAEGDGREARARPNTGPSTEFPRQAMPAIQQQPTQQPQPAHQQQPQPAQQQQQQQQQPAQQQQAVGNQMLGFSSQHPQFYNQMTGQVQDPTSFTGSGYPPISNWGAFGATTTPLATNSNATIMSPPAPAATPQPAMMPPAIPDEVDVFRTPRAQPRQLPGWLAQAPVPGPHLGTAFDQQSAWSQNPVNKFMHRRFPRLHRSDKDDEGGEKEREKKTEQNTDKNNRSDGDSRQGLQQQAVFAVKSNAYPQQQPQQYAGQAHSHGQYQGNNFYAQAQQAYAQQQQQHQQMMGGNPFAHPGQMQGQNMCQSNTQTQEPHHGNSYFSPQYPAYVSPAALQIQGQGQGQGQYHQQQQQQHRDQSVSHAHPTTTGEITPEMEAEIAAVLRETRQRQRRAHGNGHKRG
ncbi:hypothetical protein L249_0089, partial [Ophiocordyceps polyrhachis-furcata BCC 54312]